MVKTQYGNLFAQSAVMAVAIGLLVLGAFVFSLLYFASKPLVSAAAVWAIVAGFGLLAVVVAVLVAAKRKL